MVFNYAKNKNEQQELSPQGLQTEESLILKTTRELVPHRLPGGDGALVRVEQQKRPRAAAVKYAAALKPSLQ